MKKLIAFALAAVMLLSFALAETAKTPIFYDNSLTLNVVYPEGYTAEIEDVGMFKLIHMTKGEHFPEMTLLICPDDEYADLERLNDMEEADQEGYVLGLMEDYNDAEVTWLQTDYGTDVVLLNENGTTIDFAELVTVYHGYVLDLMIMATEGEVVTGDDITSAMKFLSDMDFVHVHTTD